MRTRIATVAVTAVAALGAAGAAPAAAAPFEIAQIPKCTELVPAAISVTSDPVTLNVRVLLDGVSPAQGQGIASAAQRSYNPLGITLAPSFQAVAFSGTDTEGLIRQARALYGGSRPPGIDAVYVLTSKNVTAGGDGSVAGQADCIGGVAFRDRGFAVGEAGQPPVMTLLGLRFLSDVPAKIFAHELGHVLGGHHHYANCVQTLLTALSSGTGDVCTLMFPDLTLQNFPFSAVNSVVVRGHAQRWALP